MNSLMDDLPASMSPRSDGATHELSGEVILRETLSAGERDRMYELLASYFEGTSRSIFEADLAEKDAVVVLRDTSGEIQGFSTFVRMAAVVDDVSVAAYFSGDTIVARRYWGESLLSRLWSQTVFAEADRITAAAPSTEVYWFLICSGYKTFRFLPVFFREFYPHPDRATPDKVQRVLDTLSQLRFGERYDEESGIIRLASATPLREGIADVTESRLRDLMVRFFVEKNLGHRRGDELACLTRISRENLTRAGQRMLGQASRPV